MPFRARNCVRIRDVVNVNDVGVIQRGSCLGFLHETAPALLVGELFGRQRLERDKPIQASVTRFPHSTHAAFAELRFQCGNGRKSGRPWGAYHLWPSILGCEAFAVNRNPGHWSQKASPHRSGVVLRVTRRYRAISVAVSARVSKTSGRLTAPNQPFPARVDFRKGTGRAFPGNLTARQTDARDTTGRQPHLR